MKYVNQNTIAWNKRDIWLYSVLVVDFGLAVRKWQYHRDGTYNYSLIYHVLDIFLLKIALSFRLLQFVPEVVVI